MVGHKRHIYKIIMIFSSRTILVTEEIASDCLNRHLVLTLCYKIVGMNETVL